MEIFGVNLTGISKFWWGFLGEFLANFGCLIDRFC